MYPKFIDAVLHADGIGDAGDHLKAGSMKQHGPYHDAEKSSTICTHKPAISPIRSEGTQYAPED
jgi:hypothetical protein